MEPPPKRLRTSGARATPAEVCHLVSFPIAMSVLIGTADHARAAFTDDIQTLCRCLAEIPVLKGLKHFTDYKTGLIGCPPAAAEPGTVIHPWGCISAGMVSHRNTGKRCVVSVVHHRTLQSPSEAVLHASRRVCWDNLPDVEP